MYDELRKLAKARMAHLPAGQTLQPTALVHEAYLRLLGKADLHVDSQRHFFFAAARAIRDILVEKARSKAGPKRGGGRRRVPLDEEVAAFMFATIAHSSTSIKDESKGTAIFFEWLDDRFVVATDSLEYTPTRQSLLTIARS